MLFKNFLVKVMQFLNGMMLVFLSWELQLKSWNLVSCRKNGGNAGGMRATRDGLGMNVDVSIN